MYYYLCITLVLSLYLIFKFLTKYQSPFWSSQPVNHRWDIWNHITNKTGYITTRQFKKQRDYYHPSRFHIDFSRIDDVNVLKQCISLVNNHYLREKDLYYKATEDIVYSIFSGHLHPCFLSSLYCMFDKNIIATMTSRPIYISGLTREKTPFHYVDFLCVERNNRKKGVAPSLIHSFAYDVQKYMSKNERNTAFLFKREGYHRPFVPFLSYVAKTFALKNIIPTNTSDKYPDIHHDFIETKGESFTIFSRHLENGLLNKYDFNIVPHISNIKSQIDSGSLYISYVISNHRQPQREKILALFVFRNSYTYYNDELILELCSVYVDDSYKNIHLGGKQHPACDFLSNSICALREKTGAKYILVEYLSDIEVVYGTFKKCDVLAQGPMAYYFYNFTTYERSPTSTFIIT